MIAKLSITSLLLTAFAVNIAPVSASPKSTFNHPSVPRIMTQVQSNALMKDIAANKPYSGTFTEHGWKCR